MQTPLSNDNGRARFTSHDGGRDRPIGELFKTLSSDSGHLVKQEIRLAKTELQESAHAAIGGVAKVGVAAVIALPGLMALTAALVIGLGILINSYWVSALIVGVAILAMAGVLLNRAKAAFSSGLAPRETIQTLRDDAEWAKDEAQRVKTRLTS